MRWLAALCLFALATPALANDGEFYGEGATVYPINNADISMDKEVLRIEQMGPPGDYVHHWQITVDYVFRNTSAKAVTVQMGFPEKCQRLVDDFDAIENNEGPWCKQPAIRDFIAEVDGRRAKVTVKTPKEGEPGALKGQSFDRIHTFKVKFAPGQVKKIHHTYAHNGAITSPFTSHVDYITATGALWKGAIKDFDFTVVIKQDFARVKQRQFDGNPFPAPTSKQAVDGQTHWRWQLKDFEPKGNPALELSEPGSIKRLGMVENLRLKYDTAASLDALSKAELKILRNTVYAAYGYRFKSKALQAHFAAQPWYRPRADYDAAWVSTWNLKFVQQVKKAEKRK
jgi:hypothetical protein